MDNSFCHYTSAEAFLSIISHFENQELTFWASNVYYMNDPKEMVCLYEEIQRVLPKVEKDLGYADMPLSKVQFPVRIEGDKILSTEKLLFDLFYNRIYKNFYVMSFSNQIDTLPMWSLYGNNGGGICLVFDRERINKFLFVELNGKRGDAKKLVDVIYNLEEDKTYRTIKELYMNIVNDKSKKYNSFVERKLWLMIQVLTLFSGEVKDSAYEYEKEVRLIDHIIDKKDLLDIPLPWEDLKTTTTETIEEYIKRPQIRCKDGRLIPYKEFKLPVDALISIIVGPSTNIQQQINALKIALDNAKIENVAVIPSIVPYRV